MNKHPHIYIPKELENDDEMIKFVDEFVAKENEPSIAEQQQQIINTLGQELAQLKLQFMMGGM